MLLHVQSREILQTRACVPALRERELSFFWHFPQLAQKSLRRMLTTPRLTP